MLITQFHINYLNNYLYRSGESSVTRLETTFTSAFLALMFKPFSPFFESFNEEIDQLISSGLISYWINIAGNKYGFKRKISEIGPEVLTMEHLGIGFLVCFIPLVISFVVFIAEVFSKINILRLA